MILLWIMGIIVILICAVFLVSRYNVTKRKYFKFIEKYDDMAYSNNETIKEQDINELPIQIQRYLRFVGVVGTKKVSNYSIEMTGEMRMSEDSKFAPVEVSQKSYINPNIRLFYMDMKYKGLNISGLHHYSNRKASMIVKILDILKVVDESGDIMNQAETVTFLNDMFLLAPGSLIDKRIQWQEIDKNNIKATFTSGDIIVSAKIEIDDEGKLMNFISTDRYAFIKGETLNIPWSTPIYKYKMNNGLRLPCKGSAIWHFDDHDFEYIRLNIEDVKYNQYRKVK